MLEERDLKRLCRSTRLTANAHARFGTVHASDSCYKVELFFPVRGTLLPIDKESLHEFCFSLSGAYHSVLKTGKERAVGEREATVYDATASPILKHGNIEFSNAVLGHRLNPERRSEIEVHPFAALTVVYPRAPATFQTRQAFTRKE